ncbi:hypothetical protein ABZ897_23665 [Nonomuraea sp. NPDC046802]|uniref:hypothetical protein n=1 Tax=Nonomuraea sp. NPDC046802 TaxID=3154919 RepID=UPI003408E658
MIAVAFAMMFPAACGDPGPAQVLWGLGVPTEALSDPATVGIARFLVAADGSVEVEASESVPVRPLDHAEAAGWILTLNTAEGAIKYAIAVPGEIHVVISPVESHTRTRI